MDETLPPLAARYGGQLVVASVDVSTPQGQALYTATIRELEIPSNRIGVPTMVVGDEVMVGSREIPAYLPGLIEDGLAGGGVAWPAVAELRSALEASGLAAEATAVGALGEEDGAAAEGGAGTGDGATADGNAGAGAVAGEAGRGGAEEARAGGAAAGGGGGAEADPAARPGGSEGGGAVGEAAASGGEGGAAGAGEAAEGGAGETAPWPDGADTAADAPILVPLTPAAQVRASPLDRFLLDPVGNSMAVGALLVLLSVLAWAALRVRGAGLPITVPDSAVVPGLLALGLVVAAYLSFVEVTGTDAVCGPVGDCNTVQQSPWARLFGVLPVGVLGMAGYLAMGAAWYAARKARLARSRAGSARLFWLMAFAGTAFSAWLTFLEPFVIGATCAWCVTSALVMAALLVAATGPARPEPRRRERRA
jgi:uncharacterized membrane protein